jgi:hypothetical protein
VKKYVLNGGEISGSEFDQTITKEKYGRERKRRENIPDELDQRATTGHSS